MAKIYGILIDTVAIQHYVFSGNKLKENIGASYIVKTVYGALLKQAVEKVLAHPVDLEAWEKSVDCTAMNNLDVDFEVGYIGGGNALLFFKDESKGREVVKEWTRQLLVAAPGLRIAVAIMPLDPADYNTAVRKRLFEMLEANKSEVLVNTIPLKHGITADCPVTGLSADVFHHQDDLNRWISFVAEAKLRQAENEEFPEPIERILNNEYAFTKEITDLGQMQGEDYLAIVHIDGNSFGELFEECSGLGDIRQLSQQVRQAMEEAFAGIIRAVIDWIPNLKPENEFHLQRDRGGRIILPLRPLLLGGDDVTFVAHGRLGVPLAETFLKELAKMEVRNGKILGACAGVAITKSKHPFFRGYTLAEELCKNAKKQARDRMKEKNANSSWLDFHLAYGGFSGSLEQIRANHYRVKDTRDFLELNFGPYLVTPEDRQDIKAIYHLKQGMNRFSDLKLWPRSKVKDFRAVLTSGETAAAQFLSMLEQRLNGQSLSKNSLADLLYDNYNGTKFSKKAYEGLKTPYFDQLELLDFYPDFLREEE